MRFSYLLLSWLLRKKLRMNEKEIRTVNISTTSTGEDLMLADFFADKTGHYIEIGCNHPRLYNITYSLYCRGWTGICIDPNPAFASEYERKRPRDIFLNKAIGDTSINFIYHEYAFDQLNHLTICGSPPSPQGESKLIKSSLIGVLGWDELMDRVEKAFSRIDLLLIDAECQSTKLLISAPIPRRLLPKVIVVEAPSDSEIFACKEKLEPFGYRLLVRFVKTGNMYFFRN